MREALLYACDLAREAGALLRGLGVQAPEADSKQTAIDLVTAADRRSEELILSRLAGEFPDHGVVAEEGSSRPQRSSYRWFVDPLDGTTNFAHGFPHYAVSLGLERDEEMVVGVVYDVCRGELFAGELGGGAYLNGHRLAVSSVDDLGRALLATGFPYDRHTSDVDNLDHFAALLKTAQGMRRAGSAALDLCYVAAGRVDGFWEMKLNKWDVAAGALLVTEAGGQLSDLCGGPWDGTGKEVAATNGLIHEALVAKLREGRRP